MFRFTYKKVIVGVEAYDVILKYSSMTRGERCTGPVGPIGSSWNHQLSQSWWVAYTEVDSAVC
ncbi:hypothetical protein MA16_Dca023203 [Dendrobium catenatum]|uniref:Uncharacterized protein n=1 Tax=Dendrobium catenatum TaxID=906689 RepID=A0A2I0VQA9_9ASPA|nr:hypothetical protein MA16_Dca023203 [Dendrobium catenatum]